MAPTTKHEVSLDGLMGDVNGMRRPSQLWTLMATCERLHHRRTDSLDFLLPHPISRNYNAACKTVMAAPEATSANVGRVNAVIAEIDSRTRVCTSGVSRRKRRYLAKADWMKEFVCQGKYSRLVQSETLRLPPVDSCRLCLECCRL